MRSMVEGAGLLWASRNLPLPVRFREPPPPPAGEDGMSPPAAPGGIGEYPMQSGQAWLMCSFPIASVPLPMAERPKAKNT